jgi:dTDP-4-amino-4,6-dideoxygalactose transaminase
VDACHGPIHHPLNAKASTLSFHPAKHVAAGEGGAVLTNDPEIAERIYQFRDHGRDAITKRMHRFGVNYRMAETSAALARSQLARYAENVAKRRAIAAIYDEAFGMSALGFTPVPHHHESARHLYQILVHNGRRNGVQAALLELGVGTQVHYRPVPSEPWWQAQQQGSYPGAEHFAAETLSLPLYPSMLESEVGTVIDAVAEVLT